MKKRTKTPYKIQKSDVGLGLFATEEIKKGSFIIEYTGEKISHDEANRRGGKYLFTLNEKVVLDGKGREHTARYINHACSPNAEAVVEDDAHVMIYATKHIRPGDEICYDYGSDYVDDIIKKVGCRCAVCMKSPAQSAL